MDPFESQAGLPQEGNPASRSTLLSAALVGTVAACGSGSGTDAGSVTNITPASVASSDAPATKDAARFLAQATPGVSLDEIKRTQGIGLSAWLDEQFEMPADTGHWNWLIAQGYATPANRDTAQGIDNSLWRRLISSPDTLRVRVALALSEIFVIGIDGLNMPFRQFAAANYMDILERNAFGNWRTLIGEICTSTAMGVFLSYLGNAKGNPVTGQQPDENYGREIMQLFSIGLYQLNDDGTRKLNAGNLIETYQQSDVSGMARVFTGWNYASEDDSTPDRNRRPMINVASQHESGSKQFLGITIAANSDAVQSLNTALDSLLQHPNCGPFFCTRLIQRLVTSNPGAAYVARVTAVFNASKAQGGDLKAVIRAILLDSDARDATLALQPAAGKVREPMLRFVQWARCFNAKSPDGHWALGSTADPATGLGQSPLRSATVFNFFRPGYVPPGLLFGQAGVVAPELQLSNEASVIGYVNFMQNAIGNALPAIQADYSAWLALANDTPGLLDDLNLLLAAGQVSASTLAAIRSALDSIALSSADGPRNRICAAIMLIMTCPEYLVQK